MGVVGAMQSPDPNYREGVVDLEWSTNEFSVSSAVSRSNFKKLIPFRSFIGTESSRSTENTEHVEPGVALSQDPRRLVKHVELHAIQYY